MAETPNYEIDVAMVGRMPETPTSAIYSLEGIGSYEPFVYTMLIVRGGGRTIVVNAGFPDDVEAIAAAWAAWDPRCRFERPDSMRVESILAERGVDPLEVSDLFLTPFGPYNTGKISLFENARIHVLARGWAYLMGLERDLPPLPPTVIPESELFYLVRKRWELNLLPDEAEPLPGIRTFYAGVHHPASMAIAFQTVAGTAIFSDAFFKFGNIEQMKPIGYCQDLRQCMRAYRRIKEEADLLIPMYDPDVFVRYPGGKIPPRNS